MPDPPHDLVLFVSSVEGKPVTRFGAGPLALIGAHFEGRTIVYQPRRVVGLSRDEIDRYGDHYARTLREGGLTARTREEYDAQQAAQEAVRVAEQIKIDDAAKAADKEQTS